MSTKIQSIGIIGSGLMGTGIAEVCALAGYPTVLVKATKGDPASVLAKIKGSFDARVAKGKLDADAATAALARITATSDKRLAARCDLVIEAIVEDLTEKRVLLTEIAPYLSPHAILASNTSTLKISDLAAGIRERRTIGLHFFSSRSPT